MTLDREPDNVDVSLEIPRQPGLSFDVRANLQGDELHLNIGSNFWLEYFPCTDERVEADFFESVRGMLAGRFRIVEHHRRGKAFKAVLQRPTERGWTNHSTWMRLSFPAWGTTRTILQNGPANVTKE